MWWLIEVEIQVSIGSGDGLVLWGIKPLPEVMLTHVASPGHDVLMAFTLKHIRHNCNNTIS